MKLNSTEMNITSIRFGCRFQRMFIHKLNSLCPIHKLTPTKFKVHLENVCPFKMKENLWEEFSNNRHWWAVKSMFVTVPVPLIWSVLKITQVSKRAWTSFAMDQQKVTIPNKIYRLWIYYISSIYIIYLLINAYFHSLL